MKLLLVTVLAATVAAAPRAKRGFGGPPCVVTVTEKQPEHDNIKGNSLYINGLYQRNLTSSEQDELNQYQDAVSQYENVGQVTVENEKYFRLYKL